MKILLFSFFLLLTTLVCAQNLVPNPSFEDTLCVENGFDQPGYFPAVHWYNPTSSTPDFFGPEDFPECLVNSYLGEDFQLVGEWQLPFQGENYIGIATGDGESDSREFVAIRLSEPLIQDSCYRLTFYASLSNTVTLACDGLSGYFSQDSIFNYESSSWFEVEPQISNQLENVLTDTMNWTTVAGDFIADGGEQFLCIGNHWNNEMSSFETVQGTTTWPMSYYYIDNVSVLPCYLVNIEQITLNLDASVFPNPIIDEFTILAPDYESYEIFDSFGKKVDYGVLLARTKLDLSKFSKGVYLLVLKSSNNTLIKKVIKQQ